jgi:hypothetical protein
MEREAYEKIWRDNWQYMKSGINNSAYTELCRVLCNPADKGKDYSD